MTLERNERDIARARYVHMVKGVYDHLGFKLLIVTAVIASWVTTAIAIDPKTKLCSPNLVILCIDGVILLVFVLDMVLLIIAHPKAFKRGVSPYFNLLILLSNVAWVIEHIVDSRNPLAERILLTIRIFVVFRIYMIAKLIRSVRILYAAFTSSLIHWLPCILLVAAIMNLLGAIVGHYMFGNVTALSNTTELNSNATDLGYTVEEPQDFLADFRDLSGAMLTVGTYSTVDSWTDVSDDLIKQGFFYSSRVYAIVMIWLGSYLVQNVFVSTLLMSIDISKENFLQEEKQAKEKILEYKRDYLSTRQRHDLQAMQKKQRLGKYSNFLEMVREYEKTLSHDDVIMISDLSASSDWMELYLKQIKHLDDTMRNVQDLEVEMTGVLCKINELKLKEHLKRHTTLADQVKPSSSQSSFKSPTKTTRKRKTVPEQRPKLPTIREKPKTSNSSI